MTTQHAKSNAREGDGVAAVVAEMRAEVGEGPSTIVGSDVLRWADRLEAMQAQQGAEPVAWSYERLALFTSGNHDWLHALTVDDPRQNYPASEIRNVRALYPATGAPR